MAKDFFGTLLGKNSRARVLRVFIFHPSESFTLSQLGKRSGIGGRTLKEELKFFEQLGIIKKKLVRTVQKKEKQSRKKKSSSNGFEHAWTYDNEAKHAQALATFVHQISPLQYGTIVEALQNSGKLSAVVISGCFMGDLTRPVDIIVAGEDLNEERLEYAIKGLEQAVGREIRYTSFETPEFRYRLTIQDRLIRDTLDYPHQVLLDRRHLLL